jgi:hypothetical protein
METVTRKMSQLEIWWCEMPESARWIVGSVGLATMAGILGGVLA